MKPYILQETNWKNLKTQNYNIAILPWGATEPHNYHLPYGTDTLETGKIAEIAAEKAWFKNVKVMVLPAIALGVQNPGQIELPFCLHISPSTQKKIFADIVRSLANQGIKKILILNGHGGNDFKSMIREIQPEYPDCFLGLMEWFKLKELNKLFDNPGDHAGELETSMMQYLFPELVLPLSEAGDGKSREFALKGLKDKLVWTPRNWSKVSDDTGVGDPRNSSADKGKKAVELITELISGFLIEFASCKLEDIYNEE